MLHRNGTPPARHPASGPSAGNAGDSFHGKPPPAARTEFPPDRPIDTARALAYHLGREHLAGFPLVRWCYGLLLLAVLLLPILLPAFGLWASAVPLLGAGALWLWQRAARSRSYVRFTPQEALFAPASAERAASPLNPGDKLPVYVSGLLSVEGKVRRFAALPGFYRTFATREHALLCQARPRRFLGLASWPEEEVGLWYAFFYARQVRLLRTGEIAFDKTVLPGFQLEYEPDQPLGGKPKRGQPKQITLYVAFAPGADLQAALADLMVEPIVAAQVQSSAS